MILFYLFITCLIDLKIGATEPQNLMECRHCRVLTDSFGYWFEKTSRGKFDGGDAAWEEAKLKSYSRSEIRLVEIQEGLCSELKKHQANCYSLAEVTETLLEKWWFLNNPQSIDLYSWLCIDNLQYCCPDHHFGPLCTSCLLDENQMVCSGHGKCNGDGTRKGNGTCLCDHGYTGIYCENCAKNFFRESNTCNPCHRACNECIGDGIDACKECNVGWQKVSDSCIDVNECSDPLRCKYNEYCINKEGSHTCKRCDESCRTCKGWGKLNCTSCESDSVLWNGKCVNDALKSQILRNALKRAALYSGLLIIAFFILRQSKMLSSITITIIAVYIYFSENTSDVNLLNVLLNLYLN